MTLHPPDANTGVLHGPVQRAGGEVPGGTRRPLVVVVVSLVLLMVATSCGLVANVARADEEEAAGEEAATRNTDVPVATIEDRSESQSSGDSSGDQRSGDLGHRLADDGSNAGSTSEATPPSGSTDDPESAGAEPLAGSGNCSASSIGKEDGPVISAYSIVDGELGPLCLGVENATVRSAWDSLAEIAPPSELEAIEVFAGFLPRGTGTIAFVLPVDFDFTEFIMVIDVVEAEDDPQELRLTMAHELTHVFVQSPDQIDVNAGPDDCDTYYNGFGCFLPGSYMDQWVAEFWDPEDIAGLPASGGIDEDGAFDRCNDDAGFIGQYSATHPEEDFAEAFSAYVYDVRVAEESQARYAFFERYPELVAFRDRAEAAGRLGIRNMFGRCG